MITLSMVSSSLLGSPISRIAVILLLLASSNQHVNGCFESIISFGDSVSDTGNDIVVKKWEDHSTHHCGLPPNGETYFGRPTGRCSNGRLIIDFIAEFLRLPFLPPYLREKYNNNNSSSNAKRRSFQGVNFACAGAAALDNKFYKERGYTTFATDGSLGSQLDWWKALLSSLCNNPSNCKKLLSRSLVIVGPFGGNDYKHPLLDFGPNIDEAKSLVPLVVDAIASAVEELINQGAFTIMVPGEYPIGCIAKYLTAYKSSRKEEYDSVGCLVWLNKLSEDHNTLLQLKLNEIQELHPNVSIIYADFYNASLQFYRSPYKFGFTEGSLKACCGGEGPYNYNSSVNCGPSTSCCTDPSLYVSWDGIHLTEAAYKLIAKGLVQGPYTIPHLNINSLCLSTKIHNGHSRSKSKEY